VATAVIFGHTSGSGSQFLPFELPAVIQIATQQRDSGRIVEKLNPAIAAGAEMTIAGGK